MRANLTPNLIAAAVLAFVPHAALAAGTIVSLGVYTNTLDAMSWSMGMNADGSVVVGSTTSNTLGTPNMHAFRWTQAGMQDLGTLGGYISHATGVSASGNAVVGTSNSFQNSADRAFVWTSGGGLQNIGTLGGSESRGAAISADGTVATGWALPDGDGNARAFRWTSAGMQDIGLGEGRGINADGSAIVGVTAFGGSPPRAYRWTAATGMVNLGSLGGDSYANAVSGNGSVVVGYSRLATGLYQQAFRWTSGGMQDLGLLNGANTYANGTNEDGSIVVGGTSMTTGGGRAFLWSASTGLVDLNTYLPSIGYDLTGWFLTSASAINANGDIVGMGGFNGRLRAYRITGVVVPSPAGCALLGAGSLTVFRRRRADS